MIKAVLFDLDGTLVNSLEDLANSANFALQSQGYPTHEIEKYKYFVGDGMFKLIERILPEDRKDIDECNKVLGIFMEHYKKHYVDKTVSYNGIPELVCTLKQEGYKIAVISNKAHEMAITVTKKIFGDMFDEIFGKMDGYPTKPDAALTNQLMKKLKVESYECIMVGDSGMDAAVAVNAGCIGIGVLWGYRSREELLQNGANYIAATPDELYNIIKRLK